MYIYWGFPGSSIGKESTCNAGDPSSIPWSGRSPAERISYPLQYSWASLVAHMISLICLEKKMATHSSILAWKSYGRKSLVGFSCLWGCKEWDMTEWLTFSISLSSFICGIKKKKDTNELTYKTETDTQKTNLWLPKGNRQGGTY